MDRIERCEIKYRELLHNEPVKNEGTDSEFMRILQRFVYGDISYTGTLDDQTRELIVITVLTANHILPQIKTHIQSALNAGAEPLTIREVIYQCAPFIGFPKTLNAIAVMNETFSENGIALPLPDAGTVTEDDRYDNARSIQAPLYGSNVKEKYTWLPGEFAEEIPRFLTEFCFGDFYCREGLETKKRELLIVPLLASLGGADGQVRTHTLGALKLGNSKEDILCALTHALPYIGFPRLFNALNAIKEVFEQN